MFNNANYKENLEDAVNENSILLDQDNASWFFKRWPGFMTNIPKDEFVVDGKMNAIRKAYRDTYERARMVYPTAQMFNQVKKDIEACKLFQVFRCMPKFSLLHVHNAAALSLDGLIKLVKEWDRDVIYVAYESVNGMGYMAGTLFYGVPGLHMEGVMPVKDYLMDPDHEEQLRNWLSFENVEQTAQLTYRWDKFNQIFIRSGELFDNKAYYYEYHKRFFMECMRDKIYYVELRCGFQNFSSSLFEEKTDLVFGYSTEFLTIINEAVADAELEYRRELIQQESANEEPAGDHFSVKVILCARRDLNPEMTEQREKIMKKLDAAIVWKTLNVPVKNMIIGFDFVSEEDRGKSTYSYYQKILYENFLSGYEQTPKNNDELARLGDKYEQVRMALGHTRIELLHLYLHAGESLWMEQDNIVDSIISCTTRIGHGFQMGVYPGVIGTYNSHGRPDPKNLNPEDTVGPVLEICPISNQLLGYFPDLRNHTAFQLMKQGVPCVLGNDDPQILGNPGLSYDFWEMYMASNGSLTIVKGMVFLAFLFKSAAMYNTDIHNLSNVQQFSTLVNTFNLIYWIPFLNKAKEIMK